MGRPPCCDQAGMKKGPWTPEEDIMLVSYVQEHGPGNWRAVSTTTGLQRCSKSCRLRWTNYLRPGIKRGNFTDHEEKMIIQLQALLGNKWAAIASYLPDRTDNDIKNYWNTHLKKKLKKISDGHEFAFPSPQPTSRGKWESRLQEDVNTAKQALQNALSCQSPRYSSPQLVPDFNPYDDMKLGQSSIYASSTQNIARLLKDWTKNTPKNESSSMQENSFNTVFAESSTSNEGTHSPSSQESKCGIDSSKAFNLVFDSSHFEFSSSTSPETSFLQEEIRPGPSELAPLSMLEKWLLDDQGKDYSSNILFGEYPELF